MSDGTVNTQTERFQAHDAQLRCAVCSIGCCFGLVVACLHFLAELSAFVISIYDAGVVRDRLNTLREARRGSDYVEQRWEGSGASTWGEGSEGVRQDPMVPGGSSDPALGEYWRDYPE